MAEPINRPAERITFMPSGGTFKYARVITFNSVVLVGRVTDQTPAARNNLKFDNKTVSRNHAQMWMEGGKLYVQDTKSTGGTFLNGVRLSEQGRESEPHEVLHNDIVVFGQDVPDRYGAVEFKRVEMKVLYNAMAGREEFHDGEEELVDYGSVSEVKMAVDTEFNTIWNSLMNGIENPLKRLRDMLQQGQDGDYTNSSISSSRFAPPTSNSAGSPPSLSTAAALAAAAVSAMAGPPAEMGQNDSGMRGSVSFAVGAAAAKTQTQSITAVPPPPVTGPAAAMAAAATASALAGPPASTVSFAAAPASAGVRSASPQHPSSAPLRDYTGSTTATAVPPSDEATGSTIAPCFTNDATFSSVQSQAAPAAPAASAVRLAPASVSRSPSSNLRETLGANPVSGGYRTGSAATPPPVPPMPPHLALQMAAAHSGSAGDLNATLVRPSPPSIVQNATRPAGPPPPPNARAFHNDPQSPPTIVPVRRPATAASAPSAYAPDVNRPATAAVQSPQSAATAASPSTPPPPSPAHTAGGWTPSPAAGAYNSAGKPGAVYVNSGHAPVQIQHATASKATVLAPAAPKKTTFMDKAAAVFGRTTPSSSNPDVTGSFSDTRRS